MEVPNIVRTLLGKVRKCVAISQSLVALQFNDCELCVETYAAYALSRVVFSVLINSRPVLVVAFVVSASVTLTKGCVSHTGQF